MTGKTKAVAAVAVAAVALAAYAKIASGKSGDAAAKDNARVIPVRTAKAERRKFADAVAVQGTLKARNYALVSPRVAGAIEAVFVREGDPVKAGETKLFQIDHVKLEQAVAVARQSLAVAHCALEEQKAAAEKTEAEYRKASIDYERYKKLHEQNVVTTDALEQQQSQFDQLSALRKHAQTLIALAAEEEKRAVTNLAMAEKDLRDSLELAPIDGVVSARNQEPGERGVPGQPVVRIDDTTDLEASAYLPALYYSRVTPGKTRMRLTSNGADWGEYPVSYKSPTIDPALRTFEVKCRLRGNDKGATSGALADILLTLTERDGLGVPSEAILQRNGKNSVFRLDGTTAHLVVVDTGLETEGWTEVKNAAELETATIVTMGQFLLNDGSPAQVQNEER